MSEPENNNSQAENGDAVEPENGSETNVVEGVVLNEDDDSATNDEAEASDQLIAAEEEIAKLKDAFLRAKAEQDNIRRRTEKDIANSRKFAIEGFAKELLNVHDSLKLALSVKSLDAAEDSVKSTHEGVAITLKQLDAAFAKFALVAIAPEVGDKVDPNLHQAMSLIESNDIESGCILTVIQPGFTLHDRLLRPAMVVVAK
jgi:molecular chaperone GrpE